MSQHDERDDYDDEPWRKWATPEQLLRTPASIIAAFGAIQLGFSLLGVVAVAATFVWGVFNDADPNDSDSDTEDATVYKVLAVIAILILSVGWNWIVVLGAGRMRKCRNYRLSITVAVLSAFSIPFYYCLPISSGVAIWTVVLLSRREVKARFAAVARGVVETELGRTE